MIKLYEDRIKQARADLAHVKCLHQILKHLGYREMPEYVDVTGCFNAVKR